MGWVVLKLVLIFFLLSSCSHPKPEEVVAQVGDTTIKVVHIQRALHREQGDYSERGFKNKKSFNEIRQRLLQNMIDRELLYRESLNQGTYVREEELQREMRRYKSLYTEVTFQRMLEEAGLTPEEWIETKKQNLLVKKYLDQISAKQEPMTPQQVKDYYEQHQEEFKVPESVRVRQIVTDKKEKAESILRRLRNGENFAKLARDVSLSPDRKRGGDLGFITKGSFPREFEVCFSMNPGEISPIIPSLYGFHVFKVLEKGPAKTLSLKEVEGRISLKLRQQSRERVREEVLVDLKGQVDIQIQEKLLKRIKL